MFCINDYQTQTLSEGILNLPESLKNEHATQIGAKNLVQMCNYRDEQASLRTLWLTLGYRILELFCLLPKIQLFREFYSEII